MQPRPKALVRELVEFTGIPVAIFLVFCALGAFHLTLRNFIAGLAFLLVCYGTALLARERQ